MLPINSYIILSSIVLGVSAQEWANLNCVAPRSPENGMSFIFDDGQRVEFRCHPGFKMVGNRIAECKRNRWTSPPPKCVSRSPSSNRVTVRETYDASCLERIRPGQNFVWAPKITGGHVKKYIRYRNSSYPFNSYIVAIYGCDKGYAMEDAENIRMYCRRRIWVGHRPRCIPVGAGEENLCFDNNGGCHHHCTFVRGKVHCSCKEGYILSYDKTACMRISWVGNVNVQGDDSREKEHPCKDNGGCGHICQVDDDKAVCRCLHGFELLPDGKNCIDIDECKVNNGGCEGFCQNYAGSYTCHCPPGFKLAANRKSCQDENECLRNNGRGPCSDKCENTRGGYKCSCTIPGTVLGRNNETCEDIDECKQDNFGCSHFCKNSYGNAFCHCPPGYQLDEDDKTCIDYNECEIEEFARTCNGRCINEIGSFRCEDTEELRFSTPSSPVCPPGHYIDDNGRCEDIDECQNRTIHRCHHKCINTPGSFQCACEAGYSLSRDGVCEDIDECRNRTINKCRHKCINTPGSFHCACKEGYSLRRGGVCEDIDECQNRTINRCHHKCINTPGSFRCACEDGYSLRRDGVCEDIDECRNRNIHRCHYQCVNTPGSFHCVCPDGFQLQSDGVCEDINECEDDRLGCSYKCQNVRGTAYCTCPDGFKLDANGKDCVDIDECEDELTHRCHHKCINTIGSYNCTCSPGYIMSIDGVCEACNKDSYYSEEYESCISCPEFSHTSGTGMLSRSDCICEDGFIGNLTVDDSCTDIDECKKNNGECSHSCLNTLGSYHCICPLGYHLDEDKLSCIDTDECSLGKGGCHQGCINTPGSFRCTCSEGYVVSEFNHFTCSDVDECLRDNGGCSHLCVNHEGGFYCSCKNGYRLAADFRSCVEITCRALPEPHNGKIKCDTPNKDGNVPMNTTCRVTCKQGYKANARVDLRCGKDGDWSGPLPSCVSLSCPPLERPQHGDVHPAACVTGSVDVFGKCTFTCEPGHRLVGRASVKCTKNLKWHPAKLPRCESNEFGPFIHCPSDVTVNLKPHQSTHYVKLQRPKSNMDPKHIEVYPKWIEDLEGDFPAGVTEVHFVAKHPSKNLTAACRVTVNVEDKEPPNVIGCPGDIAVYADSLDPVVVNWDEPRFEDNVGIESVAKSQRPGSRFIAGSHIIHYTAVDTSKNIAKCEFTVKVMRKECGEPRDFLHGEKNCMDSLTSRFCEPICDPGYAFFGNASEFYMCGSDGIWTPSEDIPDCSPFITEPDSGCLPGTEFREEIDTGSRICVACLQGMYWDIQTSTCVPCPLGSYQDEYGQTSCKPCTEAEASNPLCNEST